MLEARPPTLGDRFDIVRGAVDARLHPQVRGDEDSVPPAMAEEDLRIARRLGIATLIGAVAWPTAFVGFVLGPVRYDADGAYRDGSAALPIFFAAVVLIVAGLVGQLIVLPREARAARGSAGVAIPLLLLFGMGPWMWPFGLAAFLLLAILALGALWAGTWPLWATVAVVGSVLGVVLIAIVGLSLTGLDRMTGGVLFLTAGLCLVPVWLCVGGTLMRDRLVATA